MIAPRGSVGNVAVVSSTRPIAGSTTLVLERGPEAPHEPDFVADAPLVGFDAFLLDHRLYGWIRLEADRLTDILNEHAELILVNVQLERFADGRLEWLEQMRVDRDNLLAVRAGGPRGDPAPRQPAASTRSSSSQARTSSAAICMRASASAPSKRSKAAADGPLSTGWLEHWVAGQRHRQWAGTIIFNQALVDAIKLVGDEDLEFGMTSYRSSRRRLDRD